MEISTIKKILCLSHFKSDSYNSQSTFLPQQKNNDAGFEVQSVVLCVNSATAAFVATDRKSVIFQKQSSVTQFPILYKDKISVRKKMNERHS